MARKPVPHSGVTYPGWAFRPIPAAGHGLVVTAGPSNSVAPHPKPAVHWQAGTGTTLCGISTQVAPQGHRTYGLQFLLVTAMPAPRKGVAFTACAKCRSAGAVGVMALQGANNG